MHVLAFEPFDAGSHRAVRESITQHSTNRWTWLTRPGRSWKWRMRTAAIELAEAVRQQDLDAQSIDALFVTSLMSASDLRALLPRGFREKPLILYVHENQAAYPPQDIVEPRDVHFLLTNLTSAAAADRVIFNSRWNRDSFFEGVHDMVLHSRDTSLKWLVRSIEVKSCIIWPPVEPPEVELSTAGRVLHNPVRVVWPHRWEHDKGPDELLTIARQYTSSHNLRWIILGERYTQVPDALVTFQREFSDQIDHCGFVESRTEFRKWLARADWVLSTARHEFFGIAVVEALLAGALPWLPDRLSYPELLPASARKLSPMKPPADVHAVRCAIAAHLQPARAENAVRRIDDVIASLLE